jgi:uncharacterized repeat protein (TIGR01451 family)
VLINSTFQYRLEVGNLGDQNATDVVLTDNMVGGGAIVGATAGCVPGTTSVGCNLGTLPPGASTTITVEVQAGPSVITLTNTANITGTIAEDPGTLANNVSQVLTQVVNESWTDLRLTKTGPPSDVWAESTVAFYLTVENLGLLTATHVRVVDTLPVGMAFEPGGSDPACSEDPPVGGREVVVCAAVTLAPGASTTFQINAIAPVAAGSYTNDAQVQMDTPVDGVPGNNLASFTFNVVRASDLWITKSGSPSTVNAGAQLTYLLTIGNNGPSTATNVFIDDILPSSVAFVSATFDTATVTDQPCARGGDVVTCNIGTLGVSETATATIVVVPQQGGTVVNSAQVTGAETDSNTGNNSAVASNTITLLADLSIVKTAPSGGGIVGQIMTYELVVTNNGPSPATGVVVEDPLTGNRLDEMDFYEAISSQGYCEYNSSTRLVRCFLGRLSAGQLATVLLRVIPRSTASSTNPYINEASVMGNEPDDVLNNNSSAPASAVSGPPAVHLQPSCGPAGVAVRILGYNFRGTGSKPINLTWRDSTGTTILQTITPALSPTTTFTRDWAIPAGTPNGTYRLYANQEAQGSNPARSAFAPFTIPCAGPDLAVSPIDSVESAAQGEPVTFTVDITNVSSAAAAGPFNVSLYFDPTPAPVVTSTTHISSTFRQDLATFTDLSAGASRTVTFTVESLNVLTGTLPVYVVVDSDPAPNGAIAEMNETNNLAVGALEVLDGTLPDSATGTLTLTGQTRVRFGPNFVYELQPYVSVSVYSGTTWLASTYSDANGNYAFSGLPEGGAYDIKACFIQNGISYFDLLIGQLPASPWTENLWLQQGTCS